MPSGRVIFQMVLVTMGTMFLLNQVQAFFPASRRLLKGGNGGNGNGVPA